MNFPMFGGCFCSWSISLMPVSPKNTFMTQRYNYRSKGSMSRGVSKKDRGGGCPLTLEAAEIASSTFPEPSALGQAGNLSVLCPQSMLPAHPEIWAFGCLWRVMWEKFKMSPCPTRSLCRTHHSLVVSGALLKLQESWHPSALHPVCPQHLLTFCIKRWPQNPFSPKIRLGEDGTKNPSQLILP